MIRGILKTGAIALMAGAAFVGGATAGGLERGGYSVDLLFDTSPFATEAAAVYVMPQRNLNNVVDIDGGDGIGSNGIGGGATNGVRDTESYWVPRLGAKIGMGEYIDCMADYSQPYGAHSNPGRDWMGANSNTETKIDTDGYAATCSAKFQAGKGQFRVIGGVSYLDISGFKERLVTPAGIGNGIGRVDLEDTGIGWRAGVAYEIPEIAFRASAMYYSEVKLDGISGMLDLSQVNGAMIPIFGSAAMPQAFEIKVQSGVAPGWLVFGGVKWTDWSVLQSIALCPTSTAALGCSSGAVNEVTSLDLYYRDGWTVTGGVAHKFNDQLSGLVALTWDRGTATTLGTQSDTWTVGAGGMYAPSKNVEIRLGGALGVLTSGESADARITYNYGNDLVAAVSGAIKVKF